MYRFVCLHTGSNITLRLMTTSNYKLEGGDAIAERKIMSFYMKGDIHDGQSISYGAMPAFKNSFIKQSTIGIFSTQIFFWHGKMPTSQVVNRTHFKGPVSSNLNPESHLPSRILPRKSMNIHEFSW